jgi:hypothetical protein
MISEISLYFSDIASYTWRHSQGKMLINGLPASVSDSRGDYTPRTFTDLWLPAIINHYGRASFLFATTVIVSDRCLPSLHMPSLNCHLL